MTAEQRKAKYLIEKFGEALALDVAQELFNETDWSDAPFWEEVKQVIKHELNKSE